MIRIGLFTIFAIALAGCVAKDSFRNSPLTHGQAQMSLKKGVTTQTQVLETFGAPNITSLNSKGCEVWTYQRHASKSQGSNSYATLGLIGASADGFEQSSRSMTLIIKFNEHKTVSDFTSQYSSF
jgi:hypothetical protein